MGKIDLCLIRLVVELLPPVEGTDYILRAVVNELLDSVECLGLVRRKILAGAVDADDKTTVGGVELRLSLLAEGNAICFECIVGAGLTGFVAVHDMVVRRGDEINAAVDYDIGVLGRCDEREVDLSVVVCKVLVGEDALKVCDGEIVILKILDGVRERIGVIPVDNAGVACGMLGIVRVRPESAVANDGERIGLRRGSRRGRWFRSRRRGRRRRYVERRNDGLGALNRHLRRIEPKLYGDGKYAAQQQEADQFEYLFHF